MCCLGCWKSSRSGSKEKSYGKRFFFWLLDYEERFVNKIFVDCEKYQRVLLKVRMTSILEETITHSKACGVGTLHTTSRPSIDEPLARGH